MSESTIETQGGMECAPEMLHWTVNGVIGQQDTPDTASFPHFCCDQEIDSNKVGWMTDFSELFASYTLPSPAQSVQLCQDTMSKYQRSSLKGNEASTESSSDIRERRRVQNKRAQQAFRKRKDLKLQELETQVVDLKADLRHIVGKYRDLRSEHLRLQSGLTALLNVNLGMHDNFAVGPKLEKGLPVKDPAC